MNETSWLQFSYIKIINYIQDKNLAHILVLIIHNPYGSKHVVFYINTNSTFITKHFCRLHYSLVFNLKQKRAVLCSENINVYLYAEHLLQRFVKKNGKGKTI
jgi:hypothetical protein